MPKVKVTSRIFFRNLLIVYAGISMAVLVIPAVFYFLRNQPDFSMTSDGSEAYFPYIVLGAALPAYGLSYMLFSRMVAAAATEPRLEGKLQKYRTAFIIGLALAEVPAILGAVGYYMTGMEFLLANAAVSVVVMSLYLPSRSKVAAKLNLDSRQVEHINDPDYVLYEAELVNED